MQSISVSMAVIHLATSASVFMCQTLFRSPWTM